MLWDFRRFNATCGLIARRPIIEDVNSHPLDIYGGIKIPVNLDTTILTDENPV